MKSFSYLAFSFFALFTFVSFSVAADRTGGQTYATVTFVQGTARAFAKDKPAGLRLKKGSKLGREHEVRVGEGAKIEISFPDGTVMRLSEKSRVAMDELHYDKNTKSKNLKVKLGIGRLWAKVKRLVTPDSSVQITTGNAVAGVRGTVYRVNVAEDQSALVKVYDGSVYVANPPKDDAGKPGDRVGAPTPVPGPHEVPPPMHEVTMEEWHVIVKAMQEISISSQGVASQPKDFDPDADADEWVKWNQERDKQTQI